uniref:Uncharacterized protein n=1 Tax=Acanthochromis polyacanthus TaxID=80966 RepID=A0A3Q1EY91_9TELE
MSKLPSHPLSSPSGIQTPYPVCLPLSTLLSPSLSLSPFSLPSTAPEWSAALSCLHSGECCGNGYLHFYFQPQKNRKPPAHREAYPSEMPQADGEDQCSPQKEGPVSTPSTSTLDHNYTVESSPRTLKRKLDHAVDNLENARKKLKFSNQKVRRLSRQVLSLKTLVKDIRQRKLITDGGAEVLEKTFSGI